MRHESTSLSWFNFPVFLKFAAGNLVFQIVTMLCEVLVLKLVDVHHIGIWQLALLIQSYVIILRLGIVNSFNREYAYLQTSGSAVIAEKVFQTTAFHVYISTAVQGVFFLGVSAYYIFLAKSNMLALTMAVMAIYTVLDGAANFEEAKLRGTLSFNKVSNSKAITSLLSILLLILPYQFGYVGLMIRILCIQAALFGYLRYKSPLKFEGKFSYKTWKELFRDGWKFWLWSYVKTFTKTLPRLFLSTFSSLAILGLYTPINWLLLSFTLFTSSLTSYLYPLLTQQFAKSDKNLATQSLKINLIAFLLGVPIVVIVYFSIPALVKLYLPEYIKVIYPMQLASIASLFDIISISSTVWASMKNWTNMYLNTVLGLIINLLCLTWVYFNRNNILENLSKSILLSSILTALLTAFMIYLHDAKIRKKAAILSPCN